MGNGTGIRDIEDKFDELISLIKCNNNACRVVLCTVAPRKDVDVTQLNGCIERLGEHWKNQQVEIASECFNSFFKNGQLATRFYSQDGIHLTSSGVKRLLDAINRQHQIVVDFNNCVFGTKRPSNFLGRSGGIRKSLNRQQQGRSGGFGRFRCFGCNATGHKIADCWYKNQ